MRWKMKNFWNMRPLQSVPLLIRSARVCRKPMEKKLTEAVSQRLKEISGNGVTAKVDGIAVAAGNEKLMERLGIAYRCLPVM